MTPHPTKDDRYSIFADLYSRNDGSSTSYYTDSPRRFFRIVVLDLVRYDIGSKKERIVRRPRWDPAMRRKGVWDISEDPISKGRTDK
jgi:hypothetical protein